MKLYSFKKPDEKVPAEIVYPESRVDVGLPVGEPKTIP